MTKRIVLRAFVQSDRVKLERWAIDGRSADYMARTEPMRPPLLWQVIVVEGREVGTIWIEPCDEPDYATLGVLIGQSGLRGQGIGRAAIRAAIDQLAAEHCLLAIRLNARANNVRAIRCYLRCGFQLGETFTRTSSAGTYDVVRMIKHLQKQT